MFLVPEAALAAGFATELVALVVVFCVRLPAVRAALREQRRRTTFGTRTAALLNVEVSEQPLASSKRRVAIDVLVVGSCVVMCGHSVALALLQSTPPKGLLHYALPVQMWASAAMWGSCIAITLLEIRSWRYLGRSLRLWFLLAFLVQLARLWHVAAPPAKLSTPADYVDCAGTVPALVLALVAFFTADTPQSNEVLAKSGTGSADVAHEAEGDAATTRRPFNTEATASFATKLTFGWLSPLLAKGASRPLEHKDLFELQTRDSGEYNARKLSLAWERRHKTGRTATMLRAWHDAFGLRFWCIGLIQVLAVLLQYTAPIFVNRITAYVSGELEMSRFDAYACCVGIALASLLQSLANNQYNFQSARLCRNVWVAIGQSVYEKALTLDYEQRERFGLGKIVSYMQVDAGKLGKAMLYMHMCWSAPLQLAISVAMLYQYMGLPGLTSVAIFFISSLPVFIAGKANTKFVLQVLERRDRRVKFASELLGAMRMLKLFAWETALLRRLDEKRAHELRAIFKSLSVGSLFSFIFNVTPLIASSTTFAVYVWSGHTLTPAVAFTALSLFGLVRVPFIMLPLVLNGVIDIIVTNKRLSRYFNAKPRPVKSLDDLGDNSATAPLPFDGHFVSDVPPPPSGAAAIEVHGGIFKWPAVQKETTERVSWWRGLSRRPKDAGGAAEAGHEEQPSAPTLQGVELSVPQGTLVGVAGPVGCGKSSILMALVGDIPRQAGRVVMRGRVSLCVQEPWIQNATLRDNVLFGTAYDEARYKSVLKACALEPDLATLAAGDATEIGERGVNLSGGQKARIALARAVYADASIYLFDDILSAVDQQTGRHLMHEVVLGLLRERGATVVLCTHHVQWLPVCDHVVLLESGRVTEQGPPASVNLPTPESALAPASEDPALPRPPAPAAAAAAAAAPTPPADSAAAPSAAPAAVDGVEGTDDATSGDKATGGGNGKAGAKIVEEEDREKGYVSFKVWVAYFSTFGCGRLLVLCCLLTVERIFGYGGSNWWIAQWSSQAHIFGHSSTDFYLTVCFCIVGVCAMVNLTRNFLLFLSCLRTARIIHTRAITAVIASPMAFFETNPLGRLLNRFQNDQQQVDWQMAGLLTGLLITLFQTISQATLVCFNSAWLLVAFVPIAALFYLIARYFRHSSREIMRLQSTSESPIYAAFTEALNGATTIQATGSHDRFCVANLKKMDHNQRASFLQACSSMWLSVRLEALCTSVLALTAVLAVYEVAENGTTSPQAAAYAGLALSAAPALTEMLNALLQCFTQVETMMVAVERLHAYSALPAEELPNPAPPPQTWPSRGSIEFRDVAMGYRVELPTVLSGCSFTIEGGTSVGICGRTGSGKSSLLVALFRLVNVRGGRITIDGVDIATLPLAELRSKVAIIPQDPVLFSGSLRSNLDPFKEHDDSALWDLLEQCAMSDPVREHPEGLERPLEQNGSNLSAGQRQLVCMARALLKQCRVLALDEATASIDMHTDATIQRTLKERHGSATTLTIAHRLNTIMHCDVTIVMEGGRVGEMGPPLELREAAGSRFAALCAAADHESPSMGRA